MAGRKNRPSSEPPDHALGQAEALAGDRGYSYTHLRGCLKRHWIGPVIPERSDQMRSALR